MKITKNQRIETLEQIAVDQSSAFKIMADRLKSIEVESKWIIHMTGIEKPQLKQIGQSIFDGLDEKWRFAAVDADGTRCDYETKPRLDHAQWACVLGGFRRLVGDYDASNWQNSLIERDTAKELLEVDLSGELTGSDLARAMFERGDNYIMCVVGTIKEVVIIDTFQDGYFYSKGVRYLNPKPINNQGEPLTASEVGL